jgi:hypothetical protein
MVFLSTACYQYPPRPSSCWRLCMSKTFLNTVTLPDLHPSKMWMDLKTNQLVSIKFNILTEIGQSSYIGDSYEIVPSESTKSISQSRLTASNIVRKSLWFSLSFWLVGFARCLNKSIITIFLKLCHILPNLHSHKWSMSGGLPIKWWWQIVFLVNC